MAPSERTPLLPASATSAHRPAAAAAPLSPAAFEHKQPHVDPSELIPLTRNQRFGVMAGLWLATFLGALDMTITAALLNPIASSFGAAQRSGFLGTAFLLSNLTFTPLYGRLCDILGRRIANASAIFLFTLGTFLCAIAPSMNFLIMARFIAGAGGGGINTTSTVISADLFPLKQRGLLGSISTCIWAIGGALGGPLGGFLTDYLGWRTAFGLQVPLLIVSLLSGLKQISYKVEGHREKESAREKLARIDWVGCGSVFVGMGAFLVLLGAKNNENLPWSHPLVIACLVVAPAFLALFLVNEGFWAKEPILPFRILRRRTPLCVMLVTVFVAVCNFGVLYSLPVWFLTQFDGVTAGQAGAHLFPTSIGNVVGGFVAGVIIHRTGRYRGASAVAGFVSVIGVILISRLTPTSPKIAQWLDIFPMGFGFNHILNTSFVALMAAVPHTDMPAVTGCMWLFRTTGQVVGVAMTSAILQGTLGHELSEKLTGKGSAKLIRAICSDSSILPSLPPATRQIAREAYALALRHTFWFCAVGAVGAWVSVCFVPNLDLNAARSAPRAEQAAPRTLDEEEAPLLPADEADEAIAERRLERDAAERAGASV
ncbi:uncharacterized protein JCM10292_004793 [Rhodotorula paludigena]|uniref:uncharacterized protein n=1 Tax=Rhodotorula paludigena TaxID=86838 RepID=UPI00316F0DBA